MQLVLKVVPIKGSADEIQILVDFYVIRNKDTAHLNFLIHARFYNVLELCVDPMNCVFYGRVYVDLKEYI